MVQNQGETEFCWLFSLANVIVSSLWVRLRMIIFIKSLKTLFLENATDADLKRKASDFLNRKDLRQKVRRELLFGLFPKTLKGEFSVLNFPSLLLSWWRTETLCWKCIQCSCQRGFSAWPTGCSHPRSCSKVLRNYQRTDRKSNNDEKRLDELPWTFGYPWTPCSNNLGQRRLKHWRKRTSRSKGVQTTNFRPNCVA